MDERLLGPAAELYGVNPEALRALQGGHAAAVFEFERGGRAYVMRVLPPDAQVTRAQVAASQAWIAYLADHGVAVPRALPTLSGEWVTTLELDQVRYLVAAMDRVQGVRAELLPPSRWDDALFGAIGAMAGRMHAVTVDYAPPAELRCLEWDQGTNLFSGAGLEGGELGWVMPQVEEIVSGLRALPKDRESYGLAHLDLHFANFLIDPESGTLSIIDFDDCGYGWYLMDTAVLLFDILVLCGAEDRAAFAERFMRSYLDGYRRHKRFDDTWLLSLPRLLKLLEINVYAAMWKFYDPRVEAEGSWGALFMPGRRERIEGGAPYVDLDFACLAGGA